MGVVISKSRHLRIVDNSARVCFRSDERSKNQEYWPLFFVFNILIALAHHNMKFYKTNMWFIVRSIVGLYE